MTREIIKSTCKFIKEDGTQCMAYAMLNSEYCLMHNPDPVIKAKVEKARHMGGLAVKSIMGIPLNIVRTEDILGLLGQIVGDLNALPITVARQKALLSACEVGIKVLEIGEIESRLTEIEEAQGLVKHNA